MEQVLFESLFGDALHAVGVKVDQGAIEVALSSLDIGADFDVAMSIDANVGVELAHIVKALQTGKDAAGMDMSMQALKDYSKALLDVSLELSTKTRASVTSAVNRVTKLKNKDATTRWFQYKISTQASVPVPNLLKKKGEQLVPSTFRVTCSIAETGDGKAGLDALRLAMATAAVAEKAAEKAAAEKAAASASDLASDMALASDLRSALALMSAAEKAAAAEKES